MAGDRSRLLRPGHRQVAEKAGQAQDAPARGPRQVERVAYAIERVRRRALAPAFQPVDVRLVAADRNGQVLLRPRPIDIGLSLLQAMVPDVLPEEQQLQIVPFRRVRGGAGPGRHALGFPDRIAQSALSAHRGTPLPPPPRLPSSIIAAAATSPSDGPPSRRDPDVPPCAPPSTAPCRTPTSWVWSRAYPVRWLSEPPLRLFHAASSPLPPFPARPWPGSGRRAASDRQSVV